MKLKVSVIDSESQAQRIENTSAIIHTVYLRLLLVPDGSETESEWETNSTTEDHEERKWYIWSKYW